MREPSLVAFTLLSQCAVGASWALWIVRIWTEGREGSLAAGAWTGPAFTATAAAMALGLAASFLHLGRKGNAWRAVTNARRSWLSREVLSAVLFLGALVAGAALPPSVDALGGAGRGRLLPAATLALGLLLLASMSMAYRLRTAPAWDSPWSQAAFVLPALVLGCLGAASSLQMGRDVSEEARGTALGMLAMAALGGVFLQTMALSLWLRGLVNGPREAKEAAMRMISGERAWLAARMLLLGAAAVACAVAVLWDAAAGPAVLAAFAMAALSEVIGRTLFYEIHLGGGL